MGPVELFELRRRNAVLLYHLPDPAGGTVGDGAAPPASTRLVEQLRHELDDLVDTTRALLDVPHAGLNIITPDAQTALAATDPVYPRQVAREDSLCAAALDHAGVAVLIEVPGASREPLLADNPFVDGTLGSIRFYAAAPLLGREHITLGTLCVAADQPRTLTARERSVLRYLGLAATHLLDEHRRRVGVQTTN